MKSLSNFLSEALVGKKLSKIKRITSVDDLLEGDYFAVVGSISRHTNKPKRNIAIFDRKIGDSEYTAKIQVGCINENQHSKPITINRDIIKCLNVESVTEDEYKLLDAIENHLDIDAAIKLKNAKFEIIGYINNETLKIDMKTNYFKFLKNDVSEALVSKKVKTDLPHIEKLKDGFFFVCNGEEVRYVLCNDLDHYPVIIKCFGRVRNSDYEYDKLGIDNINIYDVLELHERMLIGFTNHCVKRTIRQASENKEAENPELKYVYKAIDMLCSEIDDMKSSPNNAKDIELLEDLVYIADINECDDYDSVYELDPHKNKFVKL